MEELFDGAEPIGDTVQAKSRDQLSAARAEVQDVLKPARPGQRVEL